MTHMEKMDLSDKYLTAVDSLESAIYFMETVADAFFEKLDPETPVGKLGFELDFKRYRAFARAVMENLYRTQAELPSIEQFDNLCKDNPT